MDLVLFILATIGLTVILVDSVVMQPVRDYINNLMPTTVGKAIMCVMCTGFWSGVFASCFTLNSSFVMALIFFLDMFLLAFLHEHNNILKYDLPKKDMLIKLWWAIFISILGSSLLFNYVYFSKFAYMILMGCIGTCVSYSWTLVMNYLEARSIGG